MKETYVVLAAVGSLLSGLFAVDWVAARKAKRRPTIEEALRKVPGTREEDVVKILRVLEHPSQAFNKNMPAFGPFLDLNPEQYGPEAKSNLCTRHCCTIKAAQRMLRDGTYYKL